MGLLDEPDDLQLLRGRISHSPSSPSAVTLFLSRRFSRVRSATTSLSAVASRRRASSSSEVGARAVSPARRSLPASRKSFDQRWYRFCAIPSRRHSSAMLSSPRRPSNTMRIFSSAEYCLRVARRMSWTNFSAGSLDDRVCCLIFAPCERYDEPETLPSSICQFCLTSADGGQSPTTTTGAITRASTILPRPPSTSDAVKPSCWKEKG